MTYSQYADKVNAAFPYKKYSSREGEAVTMVIVHHWAGTTGGIERLVYSQDTASANYIVLSTGESIASVPEEYRAWTSGSGIDRRAVTFETQNSTGAPGYTVSAQAEEELAVIIADVFRRHGIAQATASNLLGHRDTGYATACPGPYLYPRLHQLRARVNQLLGGATSTNRQPVDDKVLSYGATGDRVKALQVAINALVGGASLPGGKPLVVDGSFGPGTLEGLKALQKKYGLAVDGYCGPATQALLTSKGYSLDAKVVSKVDQVLKANPTATKPPAVTTGKLKRDLYTGCTGDDVRALQAELNRLFPSYSKLATDGSYGPATKAAVTEFQKRAKADGRYKSTVDGACGPATQAALRSYGARV